VQTEICGLINVPIEKVLEKYKQVIELDGDSLCLLTEDENEGIYIDYYEETTESGRHGIMKCVFGNYNFFFMPR
jgi:hypothetical protein